MTNYGYHPWYVTSLRLLYKKYMQALVKKKKKKSNLEFCDFCVNLQTLSLI